MSTRPGSALWHTVERLLAHRIRSGAYPIGQVLPREVDLAAELGVSRNTLREAMRALAEEGLVQRRKRLGTVVVRAERERPATFELDPLQSVETLHRSTTSTVRKRPRTDLPEAVRKAYLGAAPGKWVRLSLVRHARSDGLPVSTTEVYLHPRLAELAALVQPRSYSVFRLIEEATGERVKRIDTVVRPCKLDAAQATALQARKGSLGLVISRRMVSQRDELIEVSDTTLPDGRLELAFSRELPSPGFRPRAAPDEG